MTNTAPAPKKKKRLSMHQKQSLAGWAFLTPATLLIFIMSFYPMFSALLTSFKRGKPTALVWSEPLWRNYQFMLKDKVFIQSVTNTLTYLIIQVPIMLILAVIFASLFTYDGMVNNMLLKFGLISEAINWLNDPVYAKAVIIIGLVWRWTGYNMVFYLSAMQSIDYSIYEAARIDGANSYQQLMRITIPLLRPIILVTAIMSTNGTLQLFDESVNLTRGGPGNMTITMSHYIYNTMFTKNPNFGYAAAMSFVILVMVAVLAAIQMKVGDKR